MIVLVTLGCIVVTGWLAGRLLYPRHGPEEDGYDGEWDDYDHQEVGS